MEEYCMYFPFLELRKWSKKAAETRRRNCAVLPLQSYQAQFQAVARHLDVKMDIAMLQKADLDAMIISMRTAHLSPNSINSYTRTLKSFFSWCNEQGITRLNICLLYTSDAADE